eukprot:g9274.t1
MDHQEEQAPAASASAPASANPPNSSHANPPDRAANDTYAQEREEYLQTIQKQSDEEAAIAAIKAKCLNNGVNFLPWSKVLETMTFHAGYPKRIAFADAPDAMKEIMKYGAVQKKQATGGMVVPMPQMGILPSYSVTTPPAVFNDHLLLYNKESVEAGHLNAFQMMSTKIRTEETDFDKKLSGVQLKVQGMLIGERYVQPTLMRPPSTKQVQDVANLFNAVITTITNPEPGLIRKNEALEAIKLLYCFLNSCVDEIDGQYLGWACWRSKYTLELLFELNYMGLRRDDEGGLSAVTAKNEVLMRLFDAKGMAPGKQLS